MAKFQARKVVNGGHRVAMDGVKLNDARKKIVEQRKIYQKIMYREVKI